MWFCISNLPIFMVIYYDEKNLIRGAVIQNSPLSSYISYQTYLKLNIAYINPQKKGATYSNTTPSILTENLLQNIGIGTFLFWLCYSVLNVQIIKYMPMTDFLVPLSGSNLFVSKSKFLNFLLSCSPVIPITFHSQNIREK